MAESQEREAVKLYLDTQVKFWYCWLFNVHGVRFDEIHQALVHHREPWIASVIDLSLPAFLHANKGLSSASKLRSAETRWKAELLDQQVPRTPGFIVPPPPVPEPLLLLRMGLKLDDWGFAVKATPASHLSMPLPSRPVHSHIERPYRSGTSLMTSHIGVAGALASDPR